MRISTPGNKLTSVPTIVISDAGGSGAQITATIAPLEIEFQSATEGGTGAQNAVMWGVELDLRNWLEAGAANGNNIRRMEGYYAGGAGGPLNVWNKSSGAFDAISIWDAAGYMKRLRFNFQSMRYQDAAGVEKSALVFNAQSPYEVQLSTGLSIAESVAMSATSATVSAQANNYELAETSMLRVTASGGAQAITGIKYGRSGRVLWVMNVGSNDVELANQSTASDAQNRIITHTGATLVLAPNESVMMIYDATSQRWRTVGGA